MFACGVAQAEWVSLGRTDNAPRKRLWMSPASIPTVEFVGGRPRWYLPHTPNRAPANTRANGLGILATISRSTAWTKWAGWRGWLVILTTEPRISLVMRGP